MTGARTLASPVSASTRACAWWTSRSERILRRLLIVVSSWAICGVAGRAAAYDPATTHAGLTQQAVVASTLHQVLTRRLARPLGIFEPIALHPELLPVAERRLLLTRLGALDPAGGYRPGDDGLAPAVAWIVAGAVIAKTPPERVQHLFFDPSTGRGLRDAAAIDGFLHSVRLVADAGGSLRGVATGTSFSLEGESSLLWLEAPENDVGLPVFHDQIERAVADPDPAVRNSALARALLALGGVLTVLEDAGNPAQVRNDFRAAYLHGNSGSPFDRTSPFERVVADLYGVGGVPAPRTVVRRPNLRAFFTGGDGQGLADRTQRRFFSDGTVPEDGVVDHDTTPAEIVRAARESLTYALPTVSRLDLREMGRLHYLTVSEGQADAKTEGHTGVQAEMQVERNGRPTRRILAYERVPGRVRFFLDGRVYADSARALLPEIAGYAAGLIDHLLRAEVRLTLDGDHVRAAVVSPSGRIQGGRLRLLGEDAAGRRSEIASVSTEAGADEGFSVAVPSGIRRIAAVLRGQDDAGPVVAFGELALPARR